MSEDTTQPDTAADPAAFTRSGTYTFPDKGKPPENYLRRVKPVGGNFVTGVNEVVPILDGDILLKLPNSPWFAQYREPVEEPEINISTMADTIQIEEAAEKEAAEKEAAAKEAAAKEAAAKEAAEKEAASKGNRKGK
jgi:hypothetical protein